MNHSGIDDYQVYVNISRDRMGCHQERRVVRWTEPGWDEMGRALVDRQTNMIVVYARLLALGLYCGHGDGDGDSPPPPREMRRSGDGNAGLFW